MVSYQYPTLIMKRKMYTIVLIACLFMAFFACMPVRRLCLVDPIKDEIVKSFPIETGEAFTVRFIHSVERSPWIERFEVREGDEIYLMETVTFSFGAGLPTYSENFSFEEEGMTITDINEKMERLSYKVGGVIAHHALIHREKVHFFEEYIRPFKPVRIEVIEGPLYRFFIKEVVHIG